MPKKESRTANGWTQVKSPEAGHQDGIANAHSNMSKSGQSSKGVGKQQVDVSKEAQVLEELRLGRWMATAVSLRLEMLARTGPNTCGCFSALPLEHPALPDT